MSGGCARGTDTSSRPSAWPWPRFRTTAHRARKRPGPGEGARGEVHGRVPEDALPQEAGAQVFAMDAGEDVGEAPAAERPPPLREVGPQVEMERHGGIGYELVLSLAMPQAGDEVRDILLVATSQQLEERRELEEKEKEKEKAKTRNKIIPEVRGAVPSRVGGGKVPRVIPPKGISERIKQQIVDVPVHGTPQARSSERIVEQNVEFSEPQVIPQKRISKRIVEQIADDPVQQVIPQKRISQRIVKQSVDDPVPQIIPQKRISERIVKQSVDDPVPQIIPQKRISERIVKQNVDEVTQVIPRERNSERIQGHVYEGGSTSSSAAVPLDTAECAGDRGFRTFSPAQKSATERPESSAALGAEPSSRPPAAYAESMAFDEDGSVAESEPEVGAEDGAVTRFAAGFRPWRVCVRFLELQMGRPVRGCVYGDRCTFAHSWAELHPEASAQERELASYFPD